MPDGNVPASVLVPTTDIYDIEQLDITTPGLKEFLVLLTQNFNTTALAVNMKDTGYYSYTQFANSQYFPPAFDAATPYGNTQEPNAVYRTLVNMCPAGAASLPNAGAIVVPHNIPFINNTWQVTRCYGAATAPAFGANPPTFIPIPYISTTGAIAALQWDAVNIQITTNQDFTPWTKCWVVLEYIQQPSQ